MISSKSEEQGDTVISNELELQEDGLIKNNHMPISKFSLYKRFFYSFVFGALILAAWVCSCYGLYTLYGKKKLLKEFIYPMLRCVKSDSIYNHNTLSDGVNNNLISLIFNAISIILPIMTACCVKYQIDTYKIFQDYKKQKSSQIIEAQDS